MSARGPRDPQAPKSATSAQQFYIKARREAFKLEKPDLSSTEITKALADEWKDLPEDEKAPYIEKAKEDKERYQRQKDPMRPKKPKSAYMYFGEATKAELSSATPGIHIDALSKLIGEEWRKLTDEQKAPYVQQADADQERYKREMESYEQGAAKGSVKDKKNGGAGSSKDPLDAEDEEGEDELEDLKVENEDLKRKVKDLESQLDKQAKRIAQLEKAAEKAAGKAPKAKEAKETEVEKAEPPAKKAKTDKAAKGTADEPVIVEDEAHFIAWTRKVLGAKGEKADSEMLAAFEAKGNKGVAKLLAKKYKAEHKK